MQKDARGVQTMKRKLFFDGAKSAIPICLGIVPVGISYGLLAMQPVSNGVDVCFGDGRVFAVDGCGDDRIGSYRFDDYGCFLCQSASCCYERLRYEQAWLCPTTGKTPMRLCLVR